MTDNTKMREAMIDQDGAVWEKIGGAWSLYKPAQSVPVVGEPVAWMMPDGEIRHSCECTAGSFEVVYGFPLIHKPTHSIHATELERLRKKLASAEREREQSNARLHEVAVACATAERERDDAHEIIDQYKGMASRYKDCMAERDELRKDAELGECIREKFRLMKGSTAVRFLGCLGVNEPEGGFDWSKTVLELIDAAIAQGKEE